ncbi:MAG: endolytic transglycosylase MltG [Pseudomonadota bacterium]
MNKRFKQAYLISLFLFILGVSLAYINLNHYINFYGSNTKSVTVIIKRGYSVKKIGKELALNDIINHPKLFYLVHKVFFKAIPLQAGEYEIPPHSTVRNIINIMNKGMVIIHKLTIPEGTTLFDTLEKVRNSDKLEGDIINRFKEGDLLADTYHYTYGETRMDLLNKIYHKSQNIINDLWENRQEILPFKTKEEAITLASIVDKETGIASERPRIATVFINRLNKKMRLQADPTVIYAITKGEYILDRPISNKDLKMNSPYNTYLYSGLPPTPICSPGKEALASALNPLQTKELFFVANGSGGHNFSHTLKDHNNHVRSYRSAK